MRCFKLVGLLLVIIVPSLLLAEKVIANGIDWAKGLTWQQVKEKAKKENKYIFLDIYATWCGPCKEMDKRVYINDSVGDFMNDKFIAVKVQMDRTGKDDPEVKSWYTDAQNIQVTYKVRAFPTFIFLAPDGTITHRAMGFKPIQEFIKEAAISLQPGRVYKDPYEEFNKLEEEYQSGKKNFSRMWYMIKTARELGKFQLDSALSSDYLSYLSKLNRIRIYTRDNLEFLADVGLKKEEKLFALFYPDGSKVDNTMGLPGFADRVLYNAIYRDISVPFLGLKRGQTPIGNLPADTAEADWQGLHTLIRQSYPESYATRAVLSAKIVWYEQHYNHPAYYSAYLEKLERYGFDTVSSVSNTTYFNVNTNCWFLFLRINDKMMLQKAAHWMELVVQQYPQVAMYIDTYANLLYKLGDVQKAVTWEEKALELARSKNRQLEVENYTDMLAKMKQGEYTW